MHALIGHRPGAGMESWCSDGGSFRSWETAMAELSCRRPGTMARGERRVCFADRAAARTFVEDRAGYGLALTCVTFVAQLTTAVLLMVLLFG